MPVEENPEAQLKRKGSPSRGVQPEAMFELPSDNVELVRQAMNVIDICRYDQGNRRNYYQTLNMIVETGKRDGTKSLINMLYSTLDRLSSHLCSPAELRFSMEFDGDYGDEVLQRGRIAATQIKNQWERRSTDVRFAQGVFEALKYGACFLKQWPSATGEDRLPVYNSALVMPWQFGVYRPDLDNLDGQPAMVETVPMTLPEVWRRIYHLPDAEKLFERIKGHAFPGASNSNSSSSMHPVLSASTLQTGVNGGGQSLSGGLVQIGTQDCPRPTGDGNAPTVNMHELWMWNGYDYATIQIIEPDVLLTRFKRSNLLISGENVSGLHPYTLIQPNQVAGNIWGRSELEDLLEPQDFLSSTAADIRRLFGVQVDKFLGISGEGLTDEIYDQARLAGYVNLGPGGSVNDLTPQFPQAALPLLEKLIQIIEMLSGFDNLLSGKGEPGVRSGVQSNPLMKAAGARLRDRSLIVERQLAGAADLLLSIMEAKDGRNYWTDPRNPEATSFLLSNLPDDRRVVVDGHTASPIFADDHMNLIMNGLRLDLVDKVSAIEQLPFQNRDIILTRHRAVEEQRAAMMKQLQQTNPEAFYKILEHSGKKR